VLAAAVAALALAGTTDSARPPSLLTFAIVHASRGAVDPNGGICIARADGSRRTRLSRGADSSPSWSPNGRLLAFARRSATGSKIVIADAAGHVLRRFGDAALNIDPAWSPDGRRLAYAAGPPSPRIVVAGVRGRTLLQLAAQGSVERPAWSPNGRRIAFAERLEPELPGQVAMSRIVIAGVGGGGRQVVAGRAADPAWSPDGSKLAYVNYRLRFAETGDIAVSNADGSNPRQLSTTPVDESGPSWSPDGKRIAFARAATPYDSIVVAAADGSGERVAVASPSYGAFDPAWRRPVALPRARRAPCSP
jgi:Tol biopolymer transport system component